MEIITKRDNIKAVPRLFKNQYNDSLNAPSWVVGKTRGDLLRELESLDYNTATEKDISSILERNWTKLECNECGQDADVVMRMGQEPDYESYTVCLCLSCIEAAAKKLKA